MSRQAPYNGGFALIRAIKLCLLIFKPCPSLLKLMKYVVLLSAILLQGCTVLAVADAAGSAVVYGAKTAVNVLDAVTPDIVNKKKN